MNQPQRTSEQNQIAGALSQQYGIDRDRVFFPDPKNLTKPWIGADELTQIARQSDRFQSIEERFDSFIAGLNQVVHNARVIDRDGRVFERCGVAALDEKMPDGTEGDGHSLAATRALTATLSAAGFNPLRGPAHRDTQKSSITFDDQAEARKSQLRQIHALAEEGGLIIYGDEGRDDNRYKQFLRDYFGVDSVRAMNTTERASVINKLKMFNAGMENL